MQSASTPSAVAEAVADFAGQVRAQFGSRVSKVSLFGSYARGNFHRDSDIDVLVVINDLTRHERRQIFGLAYEVSASLSCFITALALSQDEFNTLREREYRIASDIEDEGIAF